MGIVETRITNLARLHQLRTIGFLIVPAELLKLSEVTTVVAVLKANVRIVKYETKRA